MTASKGDIVTVRDTRGNYQAVVVDWELGYTRNREAPNFIYQVIRIPIGKNGPSRRSVSHKVIIEVTPVAQLPKFKIGQLVRLSHRSGIVKSFEGDHYLVELPSSNTPATTKVPVWQLIIHNPEKIL